MAVLLHGVFIIMWDCYIRASCHLALHPSLEKYNVAFTDGPDSSQINNFVEQALVVKCRIALSTR